MLMPRNPKRRSRTDLLTRAKAWEILEPLTERLYGWIDRSWDWVQDILEKDPERRAIFDPSTVAAMVYDHFKTLMASGFHEEPSVEMVAEGRMARAFIGGKIILRFKKLDRQLRSRNIGTKNQESIYNQQFYLDGFPGRPTNITLGYVSDLSETKLAGVYFTCPRSFSTNHWMIQVGGTGNENGRLLFDPHGFDGGSMEARLDPKSKARKKA